jgi:hypothetical protein
LTLPPKTVPLSEWFNPSETKFMAIERAEVRFDEGGIEMHHGRLRTVKGIVV